MEPRPGGRIGHGAARRSRSATIGYLLNRHRQHRAQADRRERRSSVSVCLRPAFLLPALAHRIEHRRADDDPIRAASLPIVDKQTEELTVAARATSSSARAFENHFARLGARRGRYRPGAEQGEVTNYELTARAKTARSPSCSTNPTTFYDRDQRLQGRLRGRARRHRAETFRAHAAAEKRRAGRREPHEVRGFVANSRRAGRR